MGDRRKRHFFVSIIRSSLALGRGSRTCAADRVPGLLGSSASRPAVQNADVVGALERRPGRRAARDSSPRMSPIGATPRASSHSVRSCSSVRICSIPLRSSAEVVITTSAPDQQVFDHLVRALDAGRRGERAAYMPGEHADPQQRQADLRRRAEVEVALQPHRDEIDVGLVEAVEQHEHRPPPRGRAGAPCRRPR